MTCCRLKFKHLDEGMTGQVRFGDGDINGKGSFGFKFKNREELFFQEVYFILSLCNNIISLGQLSKKGNKIVLKGTFLWVYDDNGHLIIKVKRSSN